MTAYWLAGMQGAADLTWTSARWSNSHRVKAEALLTAGISCLCQINRVFCHVLPLLSTQETLGGNFLSLIFESLVFQLVSL